MLTLQENITITFEHSLWLSAKVLSSNFEETANLTMHKYKSQDPEDS